MSTLQDGSAVLIVMNRDGTGVQTLSAVQLPPYVSPSGLQPFRTSQPLRGTKHALSWFNTDGLEGTVVDFGAAPAVDVPQGSRRMEFPDAGWTPLPVPEFDWQILGSLPS